MAESTQARKAGRRRAVTRGTANVFADLGFPDAVALPRHATAGLRPEIGCWQGANSSLLEAVNVLGITQPEGAALRRYKLAGLSVERLMKLLTVVDQDVEIVKSTKGSLAKDRVDQRRRSLSAKCEH